MILYIGNKLSKHGNTPTSVETLGKKLNEFTPTVTVSDRRNKILRLFDMTSAVFRYRHKVRLILIDTYSTSNFYYAVICAWLARRLGIPYIPILHGGNLPHRLRKNPRLCKSLFAQAAVNVAPSRYLYEVFKDAGFDVQLIPNFLDITQYPYKSRRNVRPRLLYVRALGRIYNPAMAIEVLHRLRRRYDDAQLCMVGPDRDGIRDEFEALSRKLGVADRVEFRGKMEKKQWHELSKEYDIFINTTTADNTPVSLIEAMALGMPVVTTDVGGISYLVKDGEDALCVPSRDAEAMADRIISLIEDPALVQRITHAARKKAVSFDWETSVKKQWIKLLEGAR